MEALPKPDTIRAGQTWARKDPSGEWRRFVVSKVDPEKKLGQHRVWGHWVGRWSEDGGRTRIPAQNLFVRALLNQDRFAFIAEAPESSPPPDRMLSTRYSGDPRRKPMRVHLPRGVTERDLRAGLTAAIAAGSDIKAAASHCGVSVDIARTVLGSDNPILGYNRRPPREQ